jgi:hypothetical protein
MPRMIDKGVSLHKRLACGDTVKGYKNGGRVDVGQGVQLHRPMDPLTKARRDNGVRGMKSGGKVDGKC